jgi:hypothetical protein
LVSGEVSPRQQKLIDNPPAPSRPARPVAALKEECGRIEAEFPAWRAWHDGDSWHARLADGGPKDRVSANNPVRLRGKIREYAAS